jgi:enamine deaminase RidA (YjgF/YER057c/UK114 family)
VPSRDAVFPDHPHALYAQHRYSPAVRANGFLFVSGQVGARMDGTPEPDTERQIRLAFTSLNDVLKAAGCTFDDVIDATVFLIDAEKDLPTLLKVMGEFWGEPPYPTLTGLGVTWLSGFRFEIKVVARLPKGGDRITG